ncbi:MAG: hypothetical protein IT379_26135, partial [Deltaproteobacteria bacterium]|nr:hypothetical protein [Deltaproteobacteria bacterium]
IGASLEGYEPATRSVTFDREELSVRLTLRRTPPPPPAPVAAVQPPVRAPVARPERPAVARPSRPPVERPSRPAAPRRPTKRGAGFVTTNPY